jgi:acetolactate synthase-1/2/3 large subunit
MENNPDFVKLAESYGLRGFHVGNLEELPRVLAQALEYPGPAVIHAEVEREDNVFPMIPAGSDYSAMLLERPQGTVEKPKGST